MTGAFAIATGVAPPGRPAQGAAPSLPLLVPLATKPRPSAASVLVAGAPMTFGGDYCTLVNSWPCRYGGPLIRAWGGPYWWVLLICAAPSHSGMILMAVVCMPECTICYLNWGVAEA